MPRSAFRLWVHPLLALGALSFLAAPASAGDPTAADAIRVVQTPRPLAMLLDELESRLGTVITYEDPMWVYSGDLTDVTLEVAKDAKRRLETGAPRILVPAKGSLELSLPRDKVSGSIDAEAAVQAAIDANRAAGNPGQFRLIRDGSGFHVVPTVVRDREGHWVDTVPILDGRIDLPVRERTRIDTLRAVVEAVNGPSKPHIGLGMVVMPGKQERLTLGASGEPARQVLTTVVAGLAPKVSWRLYYDHTVDKYFLNVHYVPSAGGPR